MQGVPGIAPEDPCRARDWLDVCLLLWSSIFLETILCGSMSYGQGLSSQCLGPPPQVRVLEYSPLWGPNLANKNTRHPVKLVLQMNKELIL